MLLAVCCVSAARISRSWRIWIRLTSIRDGMMRATPSVVSVMNGAIAGSTAGAMACPADISTAAKRTAANAIQRGFIADDYTVERSLSHYHLRWNVRNIGLHAK